MNLIADYGFHVDTSAGARAYMKSVRGKGPRPMTAGRYIALCRAKHANVFGSERETDGRLIALGLNHLSPARWAELFLSFCQYWQKVAARPTTLGSSYNPDLAAAFTCWLRGVPASYCARTKGRNERLLVSGRKSKVRLYARAMGRKAADHDPSWYAGADLIRFCGRLCSEAQDEVLRLACERFYAQTEMPRTKVRLADLDPEALRRVAAMTSTLRGRLVIAYRRANGSAYDGQVQNLVGVYGAGFELEEIEARISSALFPQYAQLSGEQMLALVNGQTPQQLAHGDLSKSEAHEWLCKAPSLEPLAYLVSRLRDKVGEVISARSITIVRWLERVLEKGHWHLLEKERTIRLPGGGTHTFRFINILDEIQDVDLTDGPATGVNKAFENMHERVRESKEEGWLKDYEPLAPLPRWSIGKYARWLNSRAALVQEGREMQHCVGGYNVAVANQQCAILAIDFHGRRSTVELSPAGVVHQHYGPQNGSPPQECVRLLAAILSKNAGKRLW